MFKKPPPTPTRALRAALRALITRLRHSVEISGTTDWTPSRIDVVAAGLASDDTAAPAWPGPALRALLVNGDRGRCGGLTGANARLVWAAALHNSAGIWSESGANHRLVIRALLPGEPACGDVL